MTKLPLTHANIIHLLGIESLSLDKRKEIVTSALELAEARVLDRAMKELSGKQQKAFAAALEAEDPDAVSAFLEKNKIDLLAFLEEEVEKIKHELLEVAKE